MESKHSDGVGFFGYRREIIARFGSIVLEVSVHRIEEAIQIALGHFESDTRVGMVQVA